MQRKEKTHLLREKRYSFGMLLSWRLIELLSLLHCTLLVDLLDHAQINDELYTFSNFFNQETNL